MKKIIFTLLALLAAYSQAGAWGYHGHAAIAMIAERHLTDKAKANIEKCIDGHSIVYYASWLDNHRKEYKEWDKLRHTCDFDFETGKLYGDPIRQMRESLEILGDYKNLTDSVRKVRIYHFVHSFGDFHCPGHIEFMTNGERTHTANYPVINIDGKPLRYHTMWDSTVLTANHPDWGYMDYAHAIDSNIPQQKIDEITAGTIEDWLHDAYARSKRIYSDAPEKPAGTPKAELSVVDRDLMNDFGELACEQILKAGLRMAKLINEIFGE